MKERMKELLAILNEANVAYYKYDKPLMPDRTYDALFDELVQLERDTGIILSGSPTQKVSGDNLDELAEVRHTKPMLSAQKTKSRDEIVKFCGNRPIIISWKLDGLTLVLRYEGGKLKQAITRGAGGTVGEDVTHTARVFMNIPLEIPCKEPVEVRGEGVISWRNFEKINQDVESEPYSHPRNLAAGSVRRLDATKSKNQFLEFFAFELVTGDFASKEGQLGELSLNGFDVVPYVAVQVQSDPDTLLTAIDQFIPEEFGYPVDGLIFEYDDITYAKSLGATGHHENRLIALKWEDELYETTFLGLELATTRTGMISVTGIFADVEIEGTIVNRAYLHNLDVLQSFSLGIGDTVKLYKANKIIPQLAENITRSGTLELPEACPSCGRDLFIQTTTGGTRQLFCENTGCPARFIRKFVHFCDKTRMNLEGFSETTLKKFVSMGWLKNFGDFYTLKRHEQEIIQTEGFGQRSFDRLQAAIDKTRSCALNQFIAGMGIPMVGRSAGRILSNYFGGDWNAFERAIIEGFDFTQLEDFGQIMHDNIYAWYTDKEEEKLWRPLLDHITFIKYEEASEMNQTNPFSGKTVVATGKLQNYTRDGIQLKLLSLGAKPAGSVSKNTDYVIVGEGAGSKLVKARSLGVKVLTEEQFEAKLIIPANEPDENTAATGTITGMTEQMENQG